MFIDVVDFTSAFAGAPFPILARFLEELAIDVRGGIGSMRQTC
jgi:hypothetical protein